MVAALRFALDHDLPVRRPRRRALAGRLLGRSTTAWSSTCAALRRVAIDLERSTARVGAGLQWGELDAATQAHGLAVTGGRISDTGVAGLTLGSGSGLARAPPRPDRGLAARRDGRHRRPATSSTRPSTSTPTCSGRCAAAAGTSASSPSSSSGCTRSDRPSSAGPLLFEYERGAEVLSAYREIMEAAEDDLGGCAVLQLAPPAPFVPAELIGRPVVGIMVAAFGELERAQRLVAPLRALAPVADAVAPVPYTALQRMIDAGSPRGLQGQFESAFMDALPATAIEAVLDVAARIPSPFTDVLLQPLGGAYERVEPGATALAHRDARWMYHALSQWTDPADTPRNARLDGRARGGDGGRTRGAPPTRTTSRPTGRSACARSTATRPTRGSWPSRIAGIRSNVFCHNQNIRPSALSLAA